MTRSPVEKLAAEREGWDGRAENGVFPGLVAPVGMVVTLGLSEVLPGLWAEITKGLAGLGRRPGKSRVALT